MHCPHCQQPTNQTDEIIELHTRQTWYECPLCGTRHTVSQRNEAAPGSPRRIGERYRFSAGTARLTEQA